MGGRVWGQRVRSWRVLGWDSVWVGEFGVGRCTGGRVWGEKVRVWIVSGREGVWVGELGVGRCTGERVWMRMCGIGEFGVQNYFTELTPYIFVRFAWRYQLV